MIEQKPWGIIHSRTTGDNWYVDEIEIEKGGYSSIHYHESSQNIFYVHSGSLIVETFAGRCELTSGDSFAVEPHAWHRFFALCDCVVTEVYCSVGPTAVEITRAEDFPNGIFPGEYSLFEASELGFGCFNSGCFNDKNQNKD